jgi:hypothetical protein
MTAPSALALDPLTSLIYGFRATQTVYVIAKLGVADKLAGGPLTAPELAAQVNADPRNLQSYSDARSRMPTTSRKFGAWLTSVVAMVRSRPPS